MRKTLKLGITLLVVAAVATSGVALAFQDAGSDDLNLADSPVFQRIVDELGPLVEDGTITAAQAEAVAGALAEARPERGGRQRGPGPEAIAEFLGIDVEDLKAAHEAGTTLSEVAAANGSSADALIDFLVADAEERLAEAVADGKVDQAEADGKLAEITQRITDMVNGEIEPGEGAGPGGPGGAGGHGPGGHGPRGGFGPDGPPADNPDA